MPNFQVPGATLFYETSGSGPILLLIPGAAGTGNVFRRTVCKLATDFTAVTYDRRGFSKSYLTGEQDYLNRLNQDADDAISLLMHLSKGVPSYVFGTSSGAVVARTILLRRPDCIRRMIMHEPTLCHALPDGTRELYMDTMKQAYDVYRHRGPLTAMEGFLDYNLTPQEAKIVRRVSKSHADPFGVGNQLYWFEREVLVYPFVDVQLEELQKHKDKLIIATSEEASDLPAGMVAQIIAEKLRMRPIVLPGAHCGYLTEPNDFAQSIMIFIE